jgi:hypothetical protein
MLDISLFTTRNAIEGRALRFVNAATDFITEEVFTPAVISKTATKKYQHDRSHMREVLDEADSKSPAMEVDYGVFTSNVDTKPHKLKGLVDPHDERNADQPVADIKAKTADNIMQRLLIRRERLMVAAVTTVASYSAANTSALGASATWATTGGDPEADSLTARTAVRATCGSPANSVAMSWTGFQTLLQSPALKDKFKYTAPNMLVEQQVANVLGVQNVYVCKAQYNASIKGATDVMGDIWDDSALFFYKDTSPTGMTYGNFWVRNNLYTHEWVDNDRGSGDGRVTWLEMGWEYQIAAGAVVSSSDTDFAAGYLLRNIY